MVSWNKNNGGGDLQRVHLGIFWGGKVQYASTRHIVEKIKQIQSILVGFVTDLAM